MLRVKAPLGLGTLPSTLATSPISIHRFRPVKKRQWLRLVMGHVNESTRESSPDLFQASLNHGEVLKAADTSRSSFDWRRLVFKIRLDKVMLHVLIQSAVNALRMPIALLTSAPRTTLAELLWDLSWMIAWMVDKFVRLSPPRKSRRASLRTDPVEEFGLGGHHIKNFGLPSLPLVVLAAPSPSTSATGLALSLSLAAFSANFLALIAFFLFSASNNTSVSSISFTTSSHSLSTSAMPVPKARFTSASSISPRLTFCSTSRRSESFASVLREKAKVSFRMLMSWIALLPTRRARMRIVV